MAKRRSKTANLLLKNDRPPIKPQEEVDKTLAKIQGRGEELKNDPKPQTPVPPVVQPQQTQTIRTEVPTPEVRRSPVAPIPTKPSPATPKYIQAHSPHVPTPPAPAPPKEKRVPLTTAITPENRALLEVAALNSDASVADMLNAALQYYFSNLVIVQDQQQVEMFKQIYARKAK